MKVPPHTLSHPPSGQRTEVTDRQAEAGHPEGDSHQRRRNKSSAHSAASFPAPGFIYDQHGPIGGCLTDWHSVSRHVFACFIVRSACQGLMEDKKGLFTQVQEKVKGWKANSWTQGSGRKANKMIKKERAGWTYKIYIYFFPSNANQSFNINWKHKLIVCSALRSTFGGIQ